MNLVTPAEFSYWFHIKKTSLIVADIVEYALRILFTRYKIVSIVLKLNRSFHNMNFCVCVTY